MRHLTSGILGSFLLLASLAIPAFGEAQPAGTPVPGTLNYIEGQAEVGSKPLNSKSAGSAVVDPGQSITTENGKVEVLLTPGVFLRLGDDSSVKMISPGLANTEIQVQQGEATVEVDEFFNGNHFRVDEDGVPTSLVKRGYYDFDAARDQVAVLRGQADVYENDKVIKVKGGHAFTLNGRSNKTYKFNKEAFEADSLNQWSNLRSAYLAEANADLAPTYMVGAGFRPGWFGADWYWDPWFDCYTFIPGTGAFYSPFGWGFYSPFLAYDAPFFAYGRYPHHFGPDFHAWGPGPHYAAGFHNGVGHFGGGLRGFGHGGIGGGGFHGGGFHAGGFGGGFHGGGFGGGHGR